MYINILKFVQPCHFAKSTQFCYTNIRKQVLKKWMFKIFGKSFPVVFSQLFLLDHEENAFS